MICTYNWYCSFGSEVHTPTCNCIHVVWIVTHVHTYTCTYTILYTYHTYMHTHTHIHTIPTNTAQGCLAPSILFLSSRPQPSLVSRTNTTITVNWTAPTLGSQCADVVFSFPPLMYMIRVRLNLEVLDGYPQVESVQSSRSHTMTVCTPR